MNVLSIGNSFSTNAHKFLPQMAKAAGKELLLCNLFIGVVHLNNIGKTGVKKKQTTITKSIFRLKPK